MMEWGLLYGVPVPPAFHDREVGLSRIHKGLNWVRDVSLWWMWVLMFWCYNDKERLVH